jgi:hypothetical protein
LPGHGGGGAVDQCSKAVFEGVFAQRAAALADRHQQGGRLAAVQQSGQLGELVRWLLGVLLAALLLEDEPGDVVGEGHGRAQRQRRGEPVGDHGGQLLVEHPDGGRVQPSRSGDDAGPVAVGQQLLLAAQMPVQRR